MTVQRSLLALPLAFALVACGTDHPDPAPGPAATRAAPAATATAAQEPAVQAAQGRGVRLVSIGRFSSPLFVTSPPGDRRRVFVVEQGGKIVLLRGGKRLARPFLDVGARITSGGEQGLLGLAFAPDYARTGLFYVYWTSKDGGRNQVVEFRRANADRADASSARVVVDQADGEGNHNGGMLAFGPDGLLYAGLGDGGGGDDQHGARGNAQNLGTILGKILRIDPRRSGAKAYRIPSSNPFVGRSGARGEIYSYGLRNPYRFSFDRSTGDLTIGDVGQDAVEEVDFVRRGRGRGANFGWRPWEGNRRNFDEPAPGHVAPVITHTHGEGWCSVTGGYVVRDPDLPGLRGQYVYGDYCKGDLYAATLRAGRASGQRRVGLHVASLSSFGEDAAGRVYATSLSGPVYRLAAR
jgi:glucose/arabinose dehydrogenase